MKRISLLKIMAFGVLALVHTACENAKYDVIDNLVYINEASTSKTKELTLTEGTTRTSLTVRLVNIINQTIKANLFIIRRMKLIIKCLLKNIYHFLNQ